MPFPEEGAKKGRHSCVCVLGECDKRVNETQPKPPVLPAVEDKSVIVHLEEIKQAVLGRVSGDNEVELGEIHGFLLQRGATEKREAGTENDRVRHACMQAKEERQHLPNNS